MMELTIKAIVQNLPQVTAFVEDALDALECPPSASGDVAGWTKRRMRAAMQIDVAVDEMFTNISSYAYAPNVGEATIRFDFDAATCRAFITFEDSGVAYNPLEKPDPDVTLSADKRKIGGLGIFLVKKTMDDVLYERRDGRNILTIVKQI